MKVLKFQDLRFNSYDEYLTYLRSSISSYDDLEKVRYIYLTLLSNNFSFDLKYHLSNKTGKKEIYNGCTYNYETIDRLFKNKVILCKSFAYLFEKVCSEFDLNVKTVSEMFKYGHVYNMVYLEGYKPFTVDPQADLKYVQTHSATRLFGVEEDTRLKIIPTDKIQEIDYKIGYIDENCNYSDVYLESLRVTVSDMPLKEKFDYMLNAVNNIWNISELKYLERLSYYKRMVKICFTEFEQKSVVFLQGYMKEDPSHFFPIVILKNGISDYRPYVFTSSMNTLIEIPIHDFFEMYDIHFSTHEKVPSFIKPKKSK